MQLLADGEVTAPHGFEAAASVCGLKPSGGLDLALLVSRRECSGEAYSPATDCQPRR